jgi:hypothetical protein
MSNPWNYQNEKIIKYLELQGFVGVGKYQYYIGKKQPCEKTKAMVALFEAIQFFFSYEQMEIIRLLRLEFQTIGELALSKAYLEDILVERGVDINRFFEKLEEIKAKIDCEYIQNNPNQIVFELNTDQDQTITLTKTNMFTEIKKHCPPSIRVGAVHLEQELLTLFNQYEKLAIEELPFLMGISDQVILDEVNRLLQKRIIKMYPTPHYQFIKIRCHCCDSEGCC